MYDKRARVVGATTARIPPVRAPSSSSDSDQKRPISPTTRREMEQSTEPDKANFLRMKAYPAFPTHPIDYTLEVPPDSLTFDSRFESGNLAKAVRVRENVYDLYLSYDTETKGHTQWFYFSISNGAVGTFTFNIVNLLKFDSLYNEGLLPAVRSEKSGNEWYRGGFAVTYYENEQKRAGAHRKTYTLTFMFSFLHASDTVFFAHCVPYTFTDLNKHLSFIKAAKSDVARVNPMCLSLSGNVCELITITHNIETYRSFEEEVQEWTMSAAARRLNKQRIQRQEKLAENIGKKTYNEHRRKQGIVLTARAHPGEAPGSYMLKGVIDFLVSDSRVAKLLRKHYVFKIVPMLNPDGVRYGNYRCSTLGVDLNRRWESPNRLMHPTVYHTKKMMQAFAEWHNLVMFCDFHGHSCKRGVFAYGCSKRSCDLEDRKKSILARMVPILLSQKNPIFSFRDCHFRMDKSKESTARVVLFKELKVVNSYTIEASFFGPKSGTSFTPPRGDCHMLPADYESIGKDLCSVALYFISKTVLSKKLRAVSELIRGKSEMLGVRKGSLDRGVTRSRSMQDSLGRKITVPTEGDFRVIGTTPPITVRSQVPEYRPCFIPPPSPRVEEDEFLTELESIQEGDEEEVVSEALQETGLWTDLLDNEDLLESDDDGGESDSAPSDHGESPRFLTPKPRKKSRKSRFAGKPCKTDQAEDKPEDSDEKLQVKASHQVRVNPVPRVARPSKSPKSHPSNNPIVQFSFLEDSHRAASSEPGVREGGLRRPGRLAELLRGPELREEPPLQVMGINDKAKKFGINHYSFLALPRHIEQEKQCEVLTTARINTAQPGRRKPPDLRAKPPIDDSFRRAFRPRTQKIKEATTIEAVLQAKEMRKKSDCEISAETSLLAVLPRFKSRDAPTVDHFMLFHKMGKARKLSFKACGRGEKL